MERMKVGVVGAGAISDIYLKNMCTVFENLEVVAVCAAHIERARAKAEKYGIRACTLEELLADPEIEMIVNLTPVGKHYEIVKAALEQGKHVYTEKTLADSPEKAAELAALAKQRGLYLGCAPDTFLGAALQTARRAIDDGVVGQVHSFAISSTRDNPWLLSILPFLRAPGCGILYDYAVYYVTALVSLFGPVKRVGSLIGRPYSEYENVFPQAPDFGETMPYSNESQVSAVLQMANGVTGTLHMDADSYNGDEAYFTVYGTKGILKLTDPNYFGGDVVFYPSARTDSDSREPVVLPHVSAFSENSRGIGPAEMASAIADGRIHRANSAMACHVLDVLTALLQGEEGSFSDIASTCCRPEPFIQF